MEVLFHRWHSHGFGEAQRDLDLERRDAESADEQQVENLSLLTIPQASLFILWLVAGVMLTTRFLLRRRREVSVEAEDAESLLGETEENGEERERMEDSQNGVKSGRKLVANSDHHGPHLNRNGDVKLLDSEMKEDENEKRGFDAERTAIQEKSAFNSNTAPSNNSNKTFSSVKPPPTFDKFLLYAVGLGVILFYFFLCEVWDEWPKGERVYVRDQFMFLTLIMFMVAAAFTLRTCPDKILNREQTEEWKGWMQVMFVWYHYFRAAETYNLIRVYIACYVWMTGFGNFSFFWVRKDFSLWRMLKMLFRLNFLVVLVVMVTNNSYMLYYICAMHTYWFLSVYLFMFVLHSWNDNRLKMAAKFVAYFVCNAIIFDTPFLHYAFKPFKFVLAYEGELHEWEFRAGLDHYACFVGMLFAYNYPHYERWMNYLDMRHIDRRDKLMSVTIKGFIIGVLLLLSVIWYKEFMLRDKYAYNSIHPYISWFPILMYIVLRNMFPVLRSHYLYFFTFLGKITLETYISQLHIYLQSNAKDLIVYIPGYPLMNFVVATVIYLFCSYWLFEITTVFSGFLLPKNLKTVGIQIIIGAVVCSLAACLALLLKEASVI